MKLNKSLVVKLQTREINYNEFLFYKKRSTQQENSKLPELTENASYTVFIYEKMLVIHFSCNSISTENCMIGL